MTRPGAVRALCVTSGVLVSLGLACVTALHLVRPGLSPVADRISEYALGRGAPLMFAAFVATGVGILSLAWALSLVGGRRSPAARALLVAAGTGMVLSGIFPTDRLRSGATSDAIHSQASALATVALIASALTWSVRRVPLHRLDVALAVTAAGLGAVSPVLHRSAVSGISQRVLWLTLLMWLIVTAWRTSRRPSEPSDDDPQSPRSTAGNQTMSTSPGNSSR